METARRSEKARKEDQGLDTFPSCSSVPLHMCRLTRWACCSSSSSGVSQLQSLKESLLEAVLGEQLALGQAPMAMTCACRMRGHVYTSKHPQTYL